MGCLTDPLVFIQSLQLLALPHVPHVPVAAKLAAWLARSNNATGEPNQPLTCSQPKARSPGRCRRSPSPAVRVFPRIYMIGDNPKADVRGANFAGDPWRSMLVCTGGAGGAAGGSGRPFGGVERRKTKRGGKNMRMFWAWSFSP